VEAAARPVAPAVPVVWTLELETARVPEANVNGSLAGAAFGAETVRVDTVPNAQVLRLTQGPLLSPDRELLVYLPLKPGETLNGYSLTVSKEMASGTVPRVTKRWKASPGGPLQMKSFASGYALKLEFGQMAQGVVPGKVFIALPDPEQTVAAGTFKADTAPLQTMTAAPQAPAKAPVQRMGNVPVEDRYGLAP
jgi:hypothetical protein